jgi:hypothetical protein
MRSAGINPMDRADLYRVFELGGTIHPVSSISHGDMLAKVLPIVAQARAALNQLLGNAPQVRIDLCIPAAIDLRDALDSINQAYFTDEQGKFSYPNDAATKQIDPWHIWALDKAIQSFEAVFQAEMQTAATYWVPKRGAYSTRDLVDSFERTFLPELHAVIGETALHEYRSAGRCFAFGLWTAAGYHSCRAVEAVLRPYYCAFTGKEEKEGQTWHHLIEGLEGTSNDPKPVDKTLFYLRQLKDNERNPLMHVRVVLDEQDADLLLSAAKMVIVHMAREIQARPAQPINTLIAAAPAPTPKKAIAHVKAG